MTNEEFIGMAIFGQLLIKFVGDICRVLSRHSYGQRRVTNDKDSPCFLNIDALVDRSR